MNTKTRKSLYTYLFLQLENLCFYLILKEISFSLWLRISIWSFDLLSFLSPSQFLRTCTEWLSFVFRYGREDEEVMGLKFCNEAIMCLAQLYPPHPGSTSPEGNTPLQVGTYPLIRTFSVNRSIGRYNYFIVRSDKVLLCNTFSHANILLVMAASKEALFVFAFWDNEEITGY